MLFSLITQQNSLRSSHSKFSKQYACYAFVALSICREKLININYKLKSNRIQKGDLCREINRLNFNSMMIDERNLATMIGEYAIESVLQKEGLHRAELDIRLQNVREGLADTLEKLAEADPAFWALDSPTQADFLIRCLRANHFDAATAIEVVDSMFEFRSSHPRWPYHVTLNDDNLKNLQNFQRTHFLLEDGKEKEEEPGDITRITGAQLKEALLSGVHWILPTRDKFNRVVIAFRPQKLDLDSLSLGVYQLMGMFCTQWATGLTSRPGVEGTPEGDICATIVIDLKSMGVGNVTWFSIDDIKRGIQMWQGAFPLKLEGIYLINVGTIVGGVISLGTKFLNSKMQDRIVRFDIENHEDRSDLFNRLGGDLDYIPFSWGGRLGYEDAGDDVASDVGSHGIAEEVANDRNVSGWRNVVQETIAAAERARDESNGGENYGWWRDWVSEKRE